MTNDETEKEALQCFSGLDDGYGPCAVGDESLDTHCSNCWQECNDCDAPQMCPRCHANIEDPEDMVLETSDYASHMEAIGYRAKRRFQGMSRVEVYAHHQSLMSDLNLVLLTAALGAEEGE